MPVYGPARASIVLALRDWCGPDPASTVSHLRNSCSLRATVVWSQQYGTGVALPVPARSQHLRDPFRPAPASMVPTTRDWCGPARASTVTAFKGLVRPCPCQHGPSIYGTRAALPVQVWSQHHGTGVGLSIPARS